MALDEQKIIATLKTNSVKPGFSTWYGITEIDPNDPKQKTGVFRVDPAFKHPGVLGAMGMCGKPWNPETVEEQKTAQKNSTAIPWIMDGLRLLGFETVEQAGAFAAGFDGLVGWRKTGEGKDAPPDVVAAFDLGAKIAKAV